MSKTILPPVLAATPESDKAWMADPRVADLVTRKVEAAMIPVTNLIKTGKRLDAIVYRRLIEYLDDGNVKLAREMLCQMERDANNATR
jgi:hypothetical protein